MSIVELHPKPKYYELVTALMRDKTYRVLWGAISDSGDYIYTEFDTNLIYQENEVVSWEYIPDIKNLKIN